MAIDTQVKRQSAATVHNHWNGPSIVPSGSFDEADRIHIGWTYAGFDFVSGTATVTATILPQLTTAYYRINA